MARRAPTVASDRALPLVDRKVSTLRPESSSPGSFGSFDGAGARVSAAESEDLGIDVIFLSESTRGFFYAACASGLLCRPGSSACVVQAVLRGDSTTRSVNEESVDGGSGRRRGLEASSLLPHLAVP